MGSEYEDYGSLLNRFIQHRMSADEFQIAYLKLFKNERRQLDEALFDVLDTLFGDVDAFSSEPTIRAELEAQKPGFYLDEAKLRQRVVYAFERLEALKRRR